MKELMVAFMVWISGNTGLPVPDNVPEIVKVELCQIDRIYHRDENRKCSRPDEIHAAAVYVRSDRTIYFPDTWAPDNIQDLALLAHELTHHMQAESGQFDTAECVGALEKPAYDMQFAFIRSAGVDPWSVVGLDQAILISITKCGPKF